MKKEVKCMEKIQSSCLRIAKIDQRVKRITLIENALIANDVI